jgi:hypothetical protein
VARIRELDSDQTARRQIDVAAAFAEETPTIPRHSEARVLSQRPEAQGSASGVVDVVAGEAEYDSQEPSSDSVRDSQPVPSMVPLDVVPVLAVPRADVPWTSLGELATQLLLRVDGCSQTMSIVTGMAVPPNEGARELAALVRQGLLRLEAPPGASPPEPSEETASELELDLSVV